MMNVVNMVNIVNKKLLLVAAVICLVVAGGYYFFSQVKIDKTKLTLYGNIEIRQVNLSFQVPGKVEKMLKEEGDKVKAGELVALLDSKDYQANHDMAIAAVAQTQALETDARLRWQRNESLFQQKAVSRQAYDSAKFAYMQATANYKAAIAKEIYTQNQLKYTELYAPEEGIITVRVAEPGATVAATQTVYTVSKNKPVWIRAFVNETELGNIKHGMTATVMTDTKDPNTGKKRYYTGRIGYISPTAEFTPKAVQSTDLRTSLVYRIRVYVDEIDDFLRQGMPTTITIDLTSNG